MIWIMGEYAERIDKVEDILDGFLENFHDEATTGGSFFSSGTTSVARPIQLQLSFNCMSIVFRLCSRLSFNCFHARTRAYTQARARNADGGRRRLSDSASSYSYEGLLDAASTLSTNVTELQAQLEATRALLAEYESSCKQAPATSESISWTEAGSLFFAFQVMTTIGYGTFAPT